jgi:hypothetical protein
MAPAMIKTIESRGHRISLKSLLVVLIVQSEAVPFFEEQTGRFDGACRVEVGGGNPFLAERLRRQEVGSRESEVRSQKLQELQELQELQNA